VRCYVVYSAHWRGVRGGGVGDDRVGRKCLGWSSVAAHGTAGTNGAGTVTGAVAERPECRCVGYGGIHGAVALSLLVGAGGRGGTGGTGGGGTLELRWWCWGNTANPIDRWRRWCVVYGGGVGEHPTQVNWSWWRWRWIFSRAIAQQPFRQECG